MLGYGAYVLLMFKGFNGGMDMKRVLIVDNLEGNRVVTAMMLEEMGLDVDTAGGYEEAMQMSLDNNYDGYFIDEIDNTSGGRRPLSLALQERHGERCVPMIWYSTSRKESFPGVNQGFTDYLLKPMTPEALAAVVKRSNSFE